MDSKLENELKMMKSVNVVASEFDVQILQPLLSAKFIDMPKLFLLLKKFIVLMIYIVSISYVN